MLTAKWCFQKTSVLAFQHRRMAAECVGISGVYLKSGKGKCEGSMVGYRWSLLTKTACFCFPGAFKTFINQWGGLTQEIPTQ
jgi:hypothetical protein